MRQEIETERYLCKIKKLSSFFQNENRHVILLHTFFFLFISSGISLVLLKTMHSVKTKIYLCFVCLLTTLYISYCLPAFHDLCIRSEMQADYFGD